MDKLTITLTPTFRGYLVVANATPSPGDPLGQRAANEHFDVLDEAVDSLPRIVRSELLRIGAKDGA
jgi:hypothetical protein